MAMNERGTGRTTNIILDSVRGAINTAGKAYHCFDHDRLANNDLEVTNKVSAILGVLGIDHLRVGNVITVSPKK